MTIFASSRKSCYLNYVITEPRRIGPTGFPGGAICLWAKPFPNFCSEERSRRRIKVQRSVRSSGRSTEWPDIGAINIALLRSERPTDALKIWLRLRCGKRKETRSVRKIENSCARSSYCVASQIPDLSAASNAPQTEVCATYLTDQNAVGTRMN